MFTQVDYVRCRIVICLSVITVSLFLCMSAIAANDSSQDIMSRIQQLAHDATQTNDPSQLQRIQQEIQALSRQLQTQIQQQDASQYMSPELRYWVYFNPTTPEEWFKKEREIKGILARRRQQDLESGNTQGIVEISTAVKVKGYVTYTGIKDELNSEQSKKVEYKITEFFTGNLITSKYYDSSSKILTDIKYYIDTMTTDVRVDSYKGKACSHGMAIGQVFLKCILWAPLTDYIVVKADKLDSTNDPVQGSSEIAGKMEILVDPSQVIFSSSGSPHSITTVTISSIDSLKTDEANMSDIVNKGYYSGRKKLSLPAVSKDKGDYALYLWIDPDRICNQIQILVEELEFKKEILDAFKREALLLEASASNAAKDYKEVYDNVTKWVNRNKPQSQQGPLPEAATYDVCLKKFTKLPNTCSYEATPVCHILDDAYMQHEIQHKLDTLNLLTNQLNQDGIDFCRAPRPSPYRAQDNLEAAKVTVKLEINGYKTEIEALRTYIENLKKMCEDN